MNGRECFFALSPSIWDIRSWTFHLEELDALGFRDWTFRTRTEEYRVLEELSALVETAGGGSC